MQVVWRLGKATAAEVIAELAESTDWSHRTIRTLLGRLVEKGALATADDGNRYIYRPARQPSEIYSCGKPFISGEGLYRERGGAARSFRAGRPNHARAN